MQPPAIPNRADVSGTSSSIPQKVGRLDFGSSRGDLTLADPNVDLSWPGGMRGAIESDIRYFLLSLNTHNTVLKEEGLYLRPWRGADG